MGGLHGSQQCYCATVLDSRGCIVCSTPAAATDLAFNSHCLPIPAHHRAFGRETRSLKAAYELMQAGYTNGEPGAEPGALRRQQL